MLKNTSHKNKPIDTENRLMVITRDGTESGLEAKMGKGDQMYADEKKLNFWWWTQCSGKEEKYNTWNLYSIMNQHYLNKI